MSRNPFLVTISDLARPEARPRPVEIETSVTWEVELSRVLPEPPLVATLHLAPTSGGLVVTGTVDAEVAHTCHRCLEGTTGTVHVEVAQLFVRPSADEDEGEDYVLEGEELDLEPMLRDEVLLAMPMLPVCGDDCPGIPTGAEPGDDDDDETERSPFAALKDLFEPE